MRPFLLVALFCLSLGLAPSSALELPQPVVKTESRSDALRRVKRSVCKIELPEGGHGSGVAYRQVGEWTYILTAAHVIHYPEVLWSKIRVTVAYTYGTKDIRDLAEIVSISTTSDLAIIRVRYCLMELAQLADLDSAQGSEVLALGFPNDCFPVVVSYGFVTEHDDTCLLHSASTWFGNSGGPLLDFKTLKIVGINVHFPYFSKPFRGDMAHAERLSRIKAFLALVALSEAK